jgi:hypothetical protein
MTAHGAMTSLMTELQGLSDAEHLVLKSWLTSNGTEFPELGTPPQPRASSAAEDPARADVAGLLSAVSRAAQSIAALPEAQKAAVHDWFFWHGRDALYEFGLSDDDVGRRRIVPDDIWPQDAEHDESSDGSLRFYQENGVNRTRLVLNEFPFDWDELYAMLNT